jgi:hypothetical protein
MAGNTARSVEAATDRPPGQVPAAGAGALYGSILLAIACSCDGRLRFVAALPLTIAALLTSSAALFRAADANRLIEWRPWAVRALAAMAALGTVVSGADGEPWFEALRRGFAGLGIAIVVVAAGDDPAWRRRATTAALVGAAVVALLTPLGTPTPYIDVVTWTSAAIDALVHGVHPYIVDAADVYGGSRDFGFTVQVYPYMPATLLFLAPWGAVFGDFRIGLAVCLPVAALLLRAAGARAGTDADFVDAATLALVLHPATARVVRSGWTEPLLIVAAAAFAYLAVRRPRGSGAAFAFFLQPAVKQYVVAPVMLYVAMCAPGRRVRTIAIGALVAVITIAPFLLWNAAATINGMLFQVRALSRPRLTAISIPGLLVGSGMAYPPMWLSTVVQLAAGGLAYVRVREHGAGGLLLGSAIALLATFVVGWQAFINYYYYIGALLAIASVLLAAPRTTAT